MKDKMVFLALFMLLRVADGYISGAPVGGCDRMEPGHGHASQNDSTSPYTITTSTSTYNCSTPVDITLSGSVPFKGFLCQIRTEKDTYQTYGTLTATGTVPTTTNCGSNVASLTHTNSNNKTEATFRWTSQSNETQVYVVCTIVQKYETLWVKQVSTPISYAGGVCDDTNHGTRVMSSICLVLMGLWLTITYT